MPLRKFEPLTFEAYARLCNRKRAALGGRAETVNVLRRNYKAYLITTKLTGGPISIKYERDMGRPLHPVFVAKREKASHAHL